MASRAPLDLRVNTLKANREKVLASMKHLGARATPWSPWGLRIDLGADARDTHIDGAVLAVVPYPAQRGEDLFARQNAPGVADQQPQQVELGRGQLDARHQDGHPA